jgi:hypothetical protein
MKKNLILFFVLIILLVGTYVFQEQRTINQKEEEMTRTQLIKDQDISSLAWGKVEIYKKDAQWWMGDKLISHNLMGQILKKISSLKFVKTVEGEKKNYFSSPIDLKVNGEQWSIGDMTLDRQGFYLARGEKVIVAFIEGASGEITDDESKLEEIKLEDLKSSLNKKPEDIYETQLFRFYPRLPFGKVLIEAEGRPSYELDLIQNKINPAPIQGIAAHDNLKDKFNSLLTQVTLKKEVPYSEKLKKSFLGKIVFSDDKTQVTWELWLSSSVSADSYLIDSKSKRAWSMVGGTLKIFFLHFQDYWDKKIIPQEKFKSFTRMGVKFFQDNLEASVTVINRQPLDFECSTLKADTNKLNTLFMYLFNLAEKDQADRISQLMSSEKKQVLSESHLRLEVFGEDLLLWRKAEELIVVNLTQGFKAHFLLKDESFPSTFRDVLK